jgi:hypothetical protein
MDAPDGVMSASTIHMLRRIAKTTGILLAAVLLTGGVLYLLGMRLLLDGGGTPHGAWIESEATRAERLAGHREAQRALSPAPAAQAEPAEAKPESAAPQGSGSEGPALAPAPPEAAAVANQSPAPAP